MDYSMIVFYGLVVVIFAGAIIDEMLNDKKK